jgi:hypothetical protein
MTATIVVVGFRTRECEGYQFAIALNIIEIEVIVSGYGVSNLTPWCYHRFLSFLTAGGKEQQKSEKVNIYAVSAQFISILGAKVIIFLQISLKMLKFAS